MGLQQTLKALSNLTAKKKDGEQPPVSYNDHD